MFVKCYLLSRCMQIWSACRCVCGECGAPAFFVWNGKTAWKELLAIDGIKILGGVKSGLQTVKPKASTIDVLY